MTTERDILKIAKAEHLLVALKKEADKHREWFKKFAATISEDPHKGFTWSTSGEAFERMAKIHVLESLSYAVVGNGEWTVERFAILARREVSTHSVRGTSHSTSATSNIMTRQAIAEWLEIAMLEGGYSFNTEWFYNAQCMDPEFKAKKDEMRAQAEAATREAWNAKEATRREARNAKRRKG